MCLPNSSTIRLEIAALDAINEAGISEHNIGVNKAVSLGHISGIDLRIVTGMEGHDKEAWFGLQELILGFAFMETKIITGKSLDSLTTPL